jgi:rod shape-determining protein MreC
MLKQNFRLFATCLAIILLLVLFKNGQIFDIGIIFRHSIDPQRAINSLLNKPDDLESKYQELLASNAQLQTLVQENQQLREILDFKTKQKYNLVLADILSRDSINRNIIIINVGVNKNIKVGQAVVVARGIMVGKVLSVADDSAQIRLLTDNASKLGVSLDGQPAVAGLLSGSLGLGMNLDYIPQAQELKKDDILVSSNLDSLIPSGLVVGRVEEIKFSASELFKQAIVSPLIDFNTLSTVAIVSL